MARILDRTYEYFLDVVELFNPKSIFRSPVPTASTSADQIVRPTDSRVDVAKKKAKDNGLKVQPPPTSALRSPRMDRDHDKVEAHEFFRCALGLVPYQLANLGSTVQKVPAELISKTLLEYKKLWAIQNLLPHLDKLTELFNSPVLATTKTTTYYNALLYKYEVFLSTGVWNPPAANSCLDILYEFSPPAATSFPLDWEVWTASLRADRQYTMIPLGANDDRWSLYDFWIDLRDTQGIYLNPPPQYGVSGFTVGYYNENGVLATYHPYADPPEIEPSDQMPDYTAIYLYYPTDTPTETTYTVDGVVYDDVGILPTYDGIFFAVFKESTLWGKTAGQVKALHPEILKLSYFPKHFSASPVAMPDDAIFAEGCYGVVTDDSYEWFIYGDDSMELLKK